MKIVEKKKIDERIKDKHFNSALWKVVNQTALLNQDNAEIAANNLGQLIGDFFKEYAEQTAGGSMGEYDEDDILNECTRGVLKGVK